MLTVYVKKVHMYLIVRKNKSERAFISIDSNNTKLVIVIIQLVVHFVYAAACSYYRSPIRFHVGIFCKGSAIK